MAYTLKTSGLALNLVSCVAVDEDGTIKEFANADANANKTLGTGVAASVAAGSWKGTARQHWTSTANTGFDYHGVKFTATHRPALARTNAAGYTIFEAYHSVGGQGGNGGSVCFANNSDSGQAGININGAGKLSQYYSGGDRGASTTSVPVNGATKYAIATAYHEGASPSTRFWYGLESGSAAADGTAATSGWAGSGEEVRGIGGFEGFGNAPASRYLTALFNKELSLAEVQSLHDDWFATLFDAGGAAQDLDGDAAAQAAATGALDHGVPLQGAATGQAAASGAASVAKPLQGAAAGQASASGDLSAGPAGILTTPPLKNNAGTLLAAEAGATAHVYALSGALVVTKAAQTTNGAGVMTFSDVLLVPGTTYRVLVVLASGASGLAQLVAA